MSSLKETSKCKFKEMTVKELERDINNGVVLYERLAAQQSAMVTRSMQQKTKQQKLSSLGRRGEKRRV
jgi:hypothetical protein